LLLGGLMAWPACNPGEPEARAFRIEDRRQLIGGSSALAELGDFILENDRIRVAITQRGNSVGPGVFGGSLIDADLHRPEASFRGGRGKDQLSEIFPIGNLSIPAICLAGERGKIEDFCPQLPNGVEPQVSIVCDGRTPCRLDQADELNEDYAVDGKFPSEKAAVIRVVGQSGNYLEALGLVSIANVKSNFRFRNDYILEPGESVVRIRTLMWESYGPKDLRAGEIKNPSGSVQALPSLEGPRAIFGLLLGSSLFPTELPNMEPGIAGGDFLFFGDRTSIFAPGVGFDVYRSIREKFATGRDPFNEPVAADLIGAVGENVSYAIASADPGGKYLLPLYSGSVTAGFSHGAHCTSLPCPGTAEQCRNVMQCSQLKGVFFERLFAVGDGDIASAAAAIYSHRKEKLGFVEGRVVDEKSSSPVSGAQVHVYPVPRTMAECRPGGDASALYLAGAGGFERECLKKRGYLGQVNHMRTDRRAEDQPEGRFWGWLPEGDYYLLAKIDYRPASRVVQVKVSAERPSQAVLALQQPARVFYEIYDEQGALVPAKLTAGQCFPECSGHFDAACTGDGDCASGKCLETPEGRRCLVDNCPVDRFCDAEGRRCIARAVCSSDAECGLEEKCLPYGNEKHCRCAAEFERQAALAEGSYAPGLGRYQYTASGRGEMELEPGVYEIWASRGLEYSVDKKTVELSSGQSVQLTFNIARQVDSSGWMSGDFHVHGVNSYDAVVKHRDRVISFAGEGVEILSTSDHDYITDLAPYVHELGLEHWVATQVGLELTTVELGHFLGFPYRYREWQDGQRVREQGAIDWTGKTPDTLFDEMRALGLYGPDDTVIVVAHPRDSFFGYFDQYGLDPYTLEVKGTLFEWFPPFVQNPLGNPQVFSGRFNALELFNSKAFDMVRTPSQGELRAYNLQRKIIQQKALAGASPAEVEGELIALDDRFIRQVLERTPEEQRAIWNSQGTDGCPQFAFCTGDDDCSSGQRCDRQSYRCYRPCAADSDCPGAACREGHCLDDFPPDSAPCTSHEGVVDDWFRLLDYGVIRTGMGNSDTHKLFTQTEAGCPRNFVRLSAETPKSLDRRELARAINSGRVIASYGPLVEIWAGEAEIGGILALAAGQSSYQLRVRVQSPLWFDVDRVEVYRSGELVHVFTAAGDELHPELKVDTSGLQLPNRRVVNLDVTLDEPAPERDAWYVAIAMGMKGRDLSPVYAPHPYLKLEIGDILGRSFASVPVPLNVGGASIPRVFRVYPYAITNPVFVDVDGNGRYDPAHLQPAWAAGGQQMRSAVFPLSSSRIGKSPLSDEKPDLRLQALRFLLSRLHNSSHSGGGGGE
jgi:hypothetical protein